MKLLDIRKLAAGACSFALLAFGSVTQAGTIVLEGSDATGFHGTASGGATYTTQLFTFMQGGSSLPIVVFGSSGATPTAPSGTVFTSDLSGLSNSLYSGLYIQSPGGCCNQNLAGATTYAAQITTFVAGGGSVAIMDYQGGDWSFIHASLATPPVGVVKGFGTSGGGTGCTDGEVFNNEALIRGFTQPPPLGCWEHQAYDLNYFGPLGYLSLVDADPSYFGFNPDGSPRGAAMLALGGALGTPGCTNPAGCDNNAVPEPSAILLLGIGLMGFVTTRRRRKQ